MLITEHFVFIHLPRTGGTFLRRACSGSDVRVLVTKGHLGVEHIPEEHSDLPIFAVIRNPWDWYVSWYQWVRAHPEPDDNPEQ